MEPASHLCYDLRQLALLFGAQAQRRRSGLRIALLLRCHAQCITLLLRRCDSGRVALLCRSSSVVALHRSRCSVSPKSVPGKRLRAGI